MKGADGRENWNAEYKRMRRIWTLRNNRTELMMLGVLLFGCILMSVISQTFFMI